MTTRSEPLRLLSSEPDRIGGGNARSDFPSFIYIYFVRFGKKNFANLKKKTPKRTAFRRFFINA